MEYLQHTFFSDFAQLSGINADAVVWANRAGGKTLLAAAATLLDCIFKPNCQVRILAGSGAQAGRMYEYFANFAKNGFEDFLAGPVRKEKCSFANGSNVEVLTQSAASVRGHHVQKLRCDEVELIDPQIFEAAKFVTQSKHGIISAFEAISTMHKPYGLMQDIINSAKHFGTPIFKWCIWEVIEKCTERTCSRCPLDSDCRGKAKRADGYLKIDDCITHLRRSSRKGFEAEMLCLTPNLQNVVFDQFDLKTHIGAVTYDPNLPIYRTIDFGYVNPFVCLWIQVDSLGVVRVIDEYILCRATINTHAQNITERTPGGQIRVAATYCDPAGAAVNDVTGTSPVTQLKILGIKTIYRNSRILEGIELIRRAIRAGDGSSKIIISPKCKRLIQALRCYHYPDQQTGPGAELPVKDGKHDHPIDALRYFFINHNRSTKTRSRAY
jgi:hypothetical protein